VELFLNGKNRLEFDEVELSLDPKGEKAGSCFYAPNDLVDMVFIFCKKSIFF